MLESNKATPVVESIIVCVCLFSLKRCLGAIEHFNPQWTGYSSCLHLIPKKAQTCLLPVGKDRSGELSHPPLGGKVEFSTCSPAACGCHLHVVLWENRGLPSVFVIISQDLASIYFFGCVFSPCCFHPMRELTCRSCVNGPGTVRNQSTSTVRISGKLTTVSDFKLWVLGNVSESFLWKSPR